jgi:hypothetical protein
MVREFRRIGAKGRVKNNERNKNVLRRVKIMNQRWHTIKKINE